TPTWRCCSNAAASRCSAPTSGSSSRSRRAGRTCRLPGGRGRGRRACRGRGGSRGWGVAARGGGTSSRRGGPPRRGPQRTRPWLSPQEYEALPEALRVRALRVEVQAPGCRVRVLTLVTTLLDQRRYPKAAVAKLYERRWSVETNLRHLKETLGMDVLRCETFRGVDKELLGVVAVYKLVGGVMAEAARKQRVAPERVSFVDALRWLREAERGEELPPLKVNPRRPGRVEPRAKKRRPKPYDLMNKPRA